MLIMNSILPHHHHEEEVCFAASHCSDDESDHHETHSGQNGVEHEHHQGKSDFCSLENFYVAPVVKNLTGKVKYSILKNDFSETTDLDTNLNSLIFSSRKVWKFISIGHTELNTCCLSRALRAPPYC